PRYALSFPTRRSSDLAAAALVTARPSRLSAEVSAMQCRTWPRHPQQRLVLSPRGQVARGTSHHIDAECYGFAHRRGGTFIERARDRKSTRLNSSHVKT